MPKSFDFIIRNVLFYFISIGESRKKRKLPFIIFIRKKHGAFIVFYFPEVKSKAARGIVGLLQLSFFALFFCRLQE